MDFLLELATLVFGMAAVASFIGLLAGAWYLGAACLRFLAQADRPEPGPLPPGRSDASDARDAVGWLLLVAAAVLAWAARQILRPGGPLAWLWLPVAALALVAGLAGVARLAQTRNRRGTLWAAVAIGLLVANVLLDFD